MCEAQSDSKKQNLASALTCYTKIKELVKRNLSVISQSGEISKIKNLMCNMQSICMKLALEIHDENSKTSKNVSELSEETKNFSESIDLKNYTDSEDTFKNIPELSEDLSPFVPFRQNFEVNRNNIFGFP